METKAPLNPQDHASKMAETLAAIPEYPMRRAWLTERLVGDPVEVTAILNAAVALYRTDPFHRFDLFLTTLAATIGAPGVLRYDQTAALYKAAKEQNFQVIARMFFDPPARNDPRDPPDPEQELFPESTSGNSSYKRARYHPASLRGKALTLGERKSLARTPKRDLLTRLARDPDPGVIGVLLENPQIKVDDVVMMAARRPVRADVLRNIFESRWLVYYHVKRALVLNPYTPPSLATRLVPLIKTPDLRNLVQDGVVPEIVRGQAYLVLRQFSDASPKGG